MMSVFVCKANNVANRTTDVVLLYSEASYMLCEGLKLFKGRVPHLTHSR